MQTRFKLLNTLSDGNFHSGDALGAELGVGRSAIWRHVQTLRGYGLDIYAVTGRGYRLRTPLELLCESRIIDGLPQTARSLIADIDLHPLLDSTNSHLMRPEAMALPGGSVCLVEYQTAGRGRQGRRWVSSFGANLCFSLVWHFNGGPDALSGLSLAVAVALAEGLSSLGLSRPGLKWPNDLYIDGRKLAGILLEMSGEFSGTSRVVIGVGVNMRAPSAIDESIDQPWIALDELLPAPVSRNQAASILIAAIAVAMSEFQKEGFAPFMARWQQWDVMAGKSITLQQTQGVIEGRARGIDTTGALLIEREGEISRYHSGDVFLLREVAPS
ncbi:MAG: bifunctional biotin--[acetyl-CoA-carboxylase] ligase/biotin operon repressor BirA [Gammaproteobacteria bacterium]|nr:bifunctional biotin--[acetyl-CoA-carboxylase] ligase/biotin operon repressor BirA [Gammaproteobacteria bacterium]